MSWLISAQNEFPSFGDTLDMPVGFNGEWPEIHIVENNVKYS